MLRQRVNEVAKEPGGLSADRFGRWYRFHQSRQNEVGKAHKEFRTIRKVFLAMCQNLIEKAVPGSQLQHLQSGPSETETPPSLSTQYKCSSVPGQHMT